MDRDREIGAGQRAGATQRLVRAQDHAHYKALRDSTESLQRRYSVLIVSSSENFSRSLASVIPQTLYSPVSMVGDVSSARRLLSERLCDIVIVNAPLPDEFGSQLALDVCSEGGACALLFTSAELYSDVNARLAPYGVLTLIKPASTQTILQTLSLLCGVRERLRKMEQKTASVQEKMEEIRIVNHAKWLLIEQLKMTESEAHRYIEKQAMDRCVTRREIAETIIASRRG
ncbi:MAG: ANTAR domain-containing protein [Planctomycetia bacterium]|nr:ANTAR domain-containing protein [Planctomycetia bacterium]